ncbi:hypothetical protein CTAM01_03207 [Colletotrichum tamarilloi]|uniref:CBS domain-containing protein n=1 Tax=Colletotrichum tamarilloi TaxID=1209934 RepID=A0ABQ9RLB7_9PEZI|nr:uncharacterized protein CTAM01_03207 [Colletotrichum tamarilloi]KAK1506875.1 hypothetical protein CTAM01_03207 [Colletotrichum tamarilloi]
MRPPHTSTLGYRFVALMTSSAWLRWAWARRFGSIRASKSQASAMSLWLTGAEGYKSVTISANPIYGVCEYPIFTAAYTRAFLLVKTTRTFFSRVVELVARVSSDRRVFWNSQPPRSLSNGPRRSVISTHFPPRAPLPSSAGTDTMNRYGILTSDSATVRSSPGSLSLCRPGSRDFPDLVVVVPDSNRRKVGLIDIEDLINSHGLGKGALSSESPFPSPAHDTKQLYSVRGEYSADAMRYTLNYSDLGHAGKL